MRRKVEPELLDTLPHENPEAQQSRQDIWMINRLMGNFSWWKARLRLALRPGDRVLEIGAGSGHLGRELRRHLPGIRLDGLDICPRPDEWPPGADWHQCSALDFEGYEDYDAVIGNFLIHHFTDDQIRQLGARLADGPRLIALVETCRRRIHWFNFNLVAGLLGFGYVTRHDGRRSVRAGFHNGDLERLLGLSDQEWDIDRVETLRGTYRLIAQRK